MITRFGKRIDEHSEKFYKELKTWKRTSHRWKIQ